MPSLMINGCTGMSSPRFEEDLRLYAGSARHNSAPVERVEGAVRRQRDNYAFVPPEREEELLTEAGFSHES